MPKTRENRITPEIAGKYLGMSAQQVRSLMEYGKLEIGKVFVTDKGCKEYIITPKSFYNGTGIRLNGYEPPPTVDIDYTALAQAIFKEVMKGIRAHSQNGNVL